eukprot:228422-Amphidinium_carterae.1
MLDETGRHRLPGQKMEGNETVEEAIQRLLDVEMHELAEYIHIEEKAQVVEEYGRSSKYSIPTKYIKTIQEA